MTCGARRDADNLALRIGPCQSPSTVQLRHQLSPYWAGGDCESPKGLTSLHVAVFPQWSIHAGVASAVRAKGPALQLFAINTRVFPHSANVWDSLGEALLAAGRRDDSIAAYRRALEIDPGLGSAREALGRLGVGVGR